MGRDYLSVTLVDGRGRETSKRIEMVEQILWADLVTNANNVLTELDAVTDLQIIKADLVIQNELSLPVKDPADSNRDTGATFVGYVQGGGGKKATLKVPGFPMSKVGDGGFIDLTDTDVAAYLANWLESAPHLALLSDGENISSWIQGTLDR